MMDVITFFHLICWKTLIYNLTIFRFALTSALTVIGECTQCSRAILPFNLNGTIAREQ